MALSGDIVWNLVKKNLLVVSECQEKLWYTTSLIARNEDWIELLQIMWSNN